MNTPKKESVGRLISQLHRYSNVYMNKALLPSNIGAGQYQFLAMLFQHEGLSQDELAHLLKMDKGTTARAIAKLEKEGFVERKVFSVDKRVRKLYLTDKAYLFEAKLNEILSAWKHVLTDNMSDDEREYTLKMLEKMALNAEKFLDDESF